MHRPLAEIAVEIKQDWVKRLNGAAAPYVEALSELRCAEQRYYAETGFDAIRGFLSNAQTWQGPVARRIKSELRQILKDAGPLALR